MLMDNRYVIEYLNKNFVHIYVDHIMASILFYFRSDMNASSNTVLFSGLPMAAEEAGPKDRNDEEARRDCRDFAGNAF